MAHPVTRVVVTGLVLAGLGAEPAGAGTFHVYGLGLNGAGCPNGWQAQTAPADRFRQGNFCSRWEIQSVRDGTALQQGAFAGTSMFTGAGARFTGFSIKSSGTAQNGTFWQMAMCATPFASCQNHFPKQGTWSETETQLGSLAPAGTPFHATHLWAGVSCPNSSCADSVSAGRAVQVTHVESHAVVEDYTPPGAPSLSGVSTGWNSGQKQLRYSASDAGSGVESATLTVDGSLHRTNTHACARLPTGGYTQPVPCATFTNGEFTPERAGPARGRPPHPRGHVARRERRGRGLVAGVLGGQQRARAPDRARRRRRRWLARHERLLGDVGEPGPGQRVADCGGVLQGWLCPDVADGRRTRSRASGLTRI